MNVRQVQKSIVPILLLQLIGEIFLLFSSYTLLWMTAERDWLFSPDLCVGH
jgi:hypothetical protein